MRLLLATIFTLGLASAAQAKGALCDGSIIAGVCKEVKKTYWSFGYWTHPNMTKTAQKKRN